MYKIGLYLAAAHSKFGLERLTGARRALREMPELLAAPREELAATFTELCNRCTNRATT
jgi:hypothetical protein